MTELCGRPLIHDEAVDEWGTGTEAACYPRSQSRDRGHPIGYREKKPSLGWLGSLNEWCWRPMGLRRGLLKGVIVVRY